MSTFGRWFRRQFNAEPALFGSGIVAVSVMGIPYVVYPMLRKAGADTTAWDLDVKNSPYLHEYGSEHKIHSFDDADKLVAFSKHSSSSYRYYDMQEWKVAIDAKNPQQRDFPEARERLAAKGW